MIWSRCSSGVSVFPVVPLAVCLVPERSLRMNRQQNRGPDPADESQAVPGFVERNVRRRAIEHIELEGYALLCRRGRDSEGGGG